jgi:hypothetical protein
MVAVEVSRQQRAAIVAAPAYFDSHPKPKTQRDLTAHRCMGEVYHRRRKPPETR